MSKNCTIMQRMKTKYENISRYSLTGRSPVVIRIDGRAFHTFTRNLEKPFDDGLIEDMQLTTKYLCEEIQGAKCGYTQSDEISILLTDYENFESQGWFNYNLQKMCSISASLATAKFNQLRMIRSSNNSRPESMDSMNGSLQNIEIEKTTLAVFDARCFTIPKDDVNNYFYARQKDAVKNSIGMQAQALYSHTELHKQNGKQQQELIFQKGINWNDLSAFKKRGSFCIKNVAENEGERSYWYIMEDTPEFHKNKIIETLI